MSVRVKQCPQGEVWEDPKTAVSVPMNLAYPSENVDVSAARKLSSPSTVGTVGEASLGGHDRHSLSLQPLPFPGGWRWGSKPQASNPRSVFLVTRPHPRVIQESTQSHLIRTKEAPLRKLKGFQEPCVRR